MEAISVDLRQRICEACDDGLETRLETAERFGVSRSFVQKLLRRRSDFLSITPLPRHGGPAAKLSAAHRTLLRRLVSGHGDATLAELCVELSNAGGPSLSKPTMCRELKALRLPLKKRRCMPASERRLVSGRYAATSRSELHRCRPRDKSTWTRAASTRR